MVRTGFRLWPAVLLWVTFFLAGCAADGGLRKDLEPTAAGVNRSGRVTVRVVDQASSEGLAGVAVQFEPKLDGMPLVTDALGYVTAEVPAGRYQLSLAGRHVQSSKRSVTVEAGQDGYLAVALERSAPVLVFAGKDVDGAAPGAALQLEARVEIRDGSTLKQIRWQALNRDGRVRAALDADGRRALVKLPELPEYKRMLLYHLAKEGRLLNRWMVLGLAPSDLREAGAVSLEVSAETSSGVYSDTVEIQADLAALAAPNPGLRNLPVNQPVLLQGMDQPSYAWSLRGPEGSTAKLSDAATQHPYFIPDRPGKYELSDGGATRLSLFAGSWHGAIIYKEMPRRPQWASREGCLCHFNGPLEQTFAAWGQSGHAEIFTQVFSASARNGVNCFPCHTVGFNPAAADGGLDDAPDYQPFLHADRFWNREGGTPRTVPGGDNWFELLETYPGVAKRANVQCENCHGPNDSGAHTTLGKTGAPERMSSSALVCGSCHEKPFGDPSYRQWQQSGHASYPRALAVATVENRQKGAADCGRCHAVQGFLAWTAAGRRDRPIAGQSGPATSAELAALGLTSAQVHPLTCSVCHDPHDPGNSFRGKQQKVKLRLTAAAGMAPAEFQGQSGGRGALCIVCHSTAGGPHNDIAMPRLTGAAAPHAPQGDLLLGQNVFFVANGVFQSHGKIEDSCIWCHLKAVPKASALGYPRGGARHSFKALITDCDRCHAEHKVSVGEELLMAMALDLERLKVAIGQAVFAELGAGRRLTLQPAQPQSAELRLDAGSVKGVELVEDRGEMALELTTREAGTLVVSLARLSAGGVPFLERANGQVIAKAAWNYLMVKRDNSRGAHNPQLVLELLQATMTRLGQLTPGRPAASGG